MSVKRPFIAGNWKMNLTVAEAVALVQSIVEGVKNISATDVLIAPTFPLLGIVYNAIKSSGIFLASQNMHHEMSGAFTGEVSGRLLLEIGCSHVILGHSERRSLFHEDNALINLKAKAAVSLGLIPIICIGESLDERDADKTEKVIRSQLEGSLRNFIEAKSLSTEFILAYEPVWAIGTGKTATPEQAQDVHAFIRHWAYEVFGPDTAETLKILYGGSVKPNNTKELMNCPDIDGALVGGASLKAESFLEIIRAAC